ncbi:MAG TPA: glycosyltransferase family 2 protein, partial [Bacteroidales bacterium]|nr:glycosyltransferase family 2 protein [Bacteroidales bacterium]
MKRVAVVILNWNGKKFLEKFLPTVVKHSSADANIIIADNASTDDSIKFLGEHFPEIQIIQN